MNFPFYTPQTHRRAFFAEAATTPKFSFPFPWKRKVEGLGQRIQLSGLDEKTTKLMFTEVTNMSNLRHPNIVKLHRSFRQNEEEFVGGRRMLRKYLVAVIELVDGGDLEQFIQAHAISPARMITEDCIWYIVGQISAGVSHMHRNQLIHRDLKPANILLSHDARTIKLADLGLSRIARPHDKITTFTGTPYYMAPERINSERYGRPSDVWAIGCIVYELCTLRSPFFSEQTNVISLHQKVTSGTYPPIAHDMYSSQLEEVMLNCLSTEPSRRPSAQEVFSLTRRMVLPPSPCINRANNQPQQSLLLQKRDTASIGDLHFAAYLGDIKKLMILLGGADPGTINRKNKNQWTPLMYAAQAGWTEACDLLLAHGASDFFNAVDLANSWGHTELAQVLLQRQLKTSHDGSTTSAASEL